MDIAAAVGAERLREIMSELLDRSTAVVKRYGGTLSQFMGDGIMAVFGAPITLEDHAVRACLAALGVQEECQAACRRCPRAGRCGPAAAGGAELRSGDRR
jgi:class 3 adenylate cyclase